MSNGLTDEAIAAYAATLASYEARYQHSIDRLIPFRDERSYGMDRALVAAGRMFGIGKRPTRKLVKSAFDRMGRPNASIWAYLDEVRKQRALEAVPTVDHLCGWVYTARLEQYPHIFKIGITSDPDRRVRELQYEARTPVRMGNVEVGSYFEESYRLLCLGRLQVLGEWFFDPHLPIKAMPEFLCHGHSLEQWQRAFEASMNDVEDGHHPIGALANVYVGMLGKGA